LKRPQDLDYARLNQLSFQAYLWLPANLARDLSDTLSKKDGSDDLRAILRKIRLHLLGANDNLEALHVVVFKQQDDPN
jgi:hypothetical protein